MRGARACAPKRYSAQAQGAPLQVQLLFHTQDKVLCPPRRCNDAIGEGFLQFGPGSAGFLRSREVFFQSGGAADRHRAADPDELPGLCVEHFFILKIEDFFPDFHWFLLCAGRRKRQPSGCLQNGLPGNVDFSMNPRRPRNHAEV